MKFHSWHTGYDRHCAANPKRQQKEYRAYYADRLEELDRIGQPPLAMQYEDEWMASGRPYYNIHPGMVGKLSKMDLNKIPSHLIQMPHELSCVNLRFAQPDAKFIINEHVSAQFPEHLVSLDVPAGAWVHSILMQDYRQHAKYKSPVVGMLLDFNAQNIPGRTNYGAIMLELDPKKSLQELIDTNVRREVSPTMIEVMTNAMRMAVVIGFLANSSADLIEYDVLSKFKEQFDKGDEATRQNIIRKSRQRGKIGYNVGNDLMFLGALPRQGITQTGDGRELQYAHIREGHPHAVRYGDGKNLVKIMWYKPTVVRDDLPFKK